MAGTDQQGTNILGLVEAADQMGLQAKGVCLPINMLSEISLPAIAHIIKESDQQHHYVVVYANSVRGIQVMDPASGKLEIWKRSVFQKQWSEVMVIFSKKKDFRQRNETLSYWRRFWELVIPNKRNYFLAFIAALMFTILGLGISVYVQKITDDVLVQHNLLLLHQISLVMLLIIVMQLIFGWMKSIYVLKSGQRIDAQLVLGYFRHILKLPQRFFDTNQVGEIISRVNDAIKIRFFVNDLAIELLVNSLIVIFSFSFLVFYSWRLSLVMALIMPLYAITFAVVDRRNQKTERSLMENAAELESILVENVSQIKTLKQFVLESFANNSFQRSFGSFLSTYYRSGLTDISGKATTQLLSAGFVLILLWLGSVYVIEDVITTGELFSCYALMAYFSGPISSLIGMNKTIQNALIAADRLFEIMDLACEDEPLFQKLEKTRLGNIQFDGISFGYGNRREILRDFSTTINQGQITAIVGESGSGKSTLISLLQKLYQPGSGRIKIGDYDLQQISKASLQEIMAVVPQQLDLFSGSILENIALGDPGPDMERVKDICDQLEIEKMIEDLPFGFKTRVGQNGLMQSGGQRQRIAIARALYRDPDILLLDEAGSALDAHSEELVWSVLCQLREHGKTIIMVSHQLHTIARADRILVLDSAKIVEEGTHDQLLATRGKYYMMWKLQNQRSLSQLY